MQTLCEIFGIVCTPGVLGSDSDSPSCVAERARVVKGGIEGVLKRKNTGKEAAMHRVDCTPTWESDVPTAVTELWIGDDEQYTEGAGLLVADLIAVGVIPRLDADPADSSHDDDVNLSDIPCAAGVEYVSVSRCPSTAADACMGTSSDEFRDIESHAGGGDVVAEAEAVEIGEGEGMCAGTLLAFDHDSTLEVEGAESCIPEAETVYTGRLCPGLGALLDIEVTGILASDSEIETEIVTNTNTRMEVESVAAAMHGCSVDDDKKKDVNLEELEKENGQGPSQRQRVEQGQERLVESSNQWPIEFVMSWNRRIAESAIFFDLMLKAGFTCEHKGKCVYSFTVNTTTAHRI